MIYLDTSCLVSLLLEEDRSGMDREAIAREELVIVSLLAELEAEVQLKAMRAGGILRISLWRQLQARIAAMRNEDPFHFRALPAAVFSTALRQHRHPRSTYCRALDRLHLAGMEELRVTRLMTLDDKQAAVAEGLGFRVVRPDYNGQQPAPVR